MRKGADVLSKWLGESERQLRLLFEEAVKQQPSIIFFDEIDGLAPVRSSKQDQIHNSIVSTLLALMDGLDSRGQVVIIGKRASRVLVRLRVWGWGVAEAGLGEQDSSPGVHVNG